MGNLSKMRDAADLLYSSKNYEDAFSIYDEIYTQIICSIGKVQSAISGFSYDFLSQNIRSSIEFRAVYTEKAANTIFIKWFEMDSDQTLNELTFAVYGHLKSIAASRVLTERYAAQGILAEFLLLYSLVLNISENWVATVVKLISPVVEDNRLRKIRNNISDSEITKVIIHSSEKVKKTDWTGINNVLIEYMQNVRS